MIIYSSLLPFVGKRVLMTYGFDPFFRVLHGLYLHNRTRLILLCFPYLHIKCNDLVNKSQIVTEYTSSGRADTSYSKPSSRSTEHSQNPSSSFYSSSSSSSSLHICDETTTRRNLLWFVPRYRTQHQIPSCNLEGKRRRSRPRNNWPDNTQEWTKKKLTDSTTRSRRHTKLANTVEVASIRPSGRGRR